MGTLSDQAVILGENTVWEIPFFLTIFSLHLFIWELISLEMADLQTLSCCLPFRKAAGNQLQFCCCHPLCICCSGTCFPNTRDIFCLCGNTQWPSQWQRTLLPSFYDPFISWANTEKHFSSGLHFSLTWGLPFFRLFGVKEPVAHHKFVHRSGENQTPAPDRHEPLWFIFAAQPSPWGLNSFHHFLVLIYFALINKQHFSDLRIQLATDLHIHRKRKKEEDQEGCGLFWDETHLVSLQCCGSNSTFPEALLCFHTVLH